MQMIMRYHLEFGPLPRYDYFCSANDRTVEVVHSITATLRTWGDVCKAAGLKPGKTPATAKVQRMIAPTVLLGTKRGSSGSGHGSGGCCGEAGCHG
jgi:hypothetical protein